MLASTLTLQNHYRPSKYYWRRLPDNSIHYSYRCLMRNLLSGRYYPLPQFWKLGSLWLRFCFISKIVLVDCGNCLSFHDSLLLEGGRGQGCLIVLVNTALISRSTNAQQDPEMWLKLEGIKVLQNVSLLCLSAIIQLVLALPKSLM